MHQPDVIFRPAQIKQIASALHIGFHDAAVLVAMHRDPCRCMDDGLGIAQ